MATVSDGSASFVVQIKSSTTEKYITNIADSYEEASQLINKYEEESTLKFATWIQSKDFGHIDIYEKKHKIWWEDEVFCFNGIPFIILGNKILDCAYGKDRNLCAKKRRISTDSDNPYKNPRSLRMTKKYGCPAQIFIKEIVHFPEYKIFSNTKWKREAGSKRLRLSIKDRLVETFKRSFIVLIPHPSSHFNHPNEVIEEHPRQEHIEEKLPIPLTKQSKKRPINLGPSCRKLLDEIKALSYLVEDQGDIIKDLHGNLDNAKNFLVSVINERGDNTKTSDIIDDANEQQTTNHIIVTKGENTQESDIDEQDKLPKHNTVIVRRDSLDESQQLEMDDKEVHLYLEPESSAEETPNNVIKVITINPSNEVVESPVVVETAENLVDDEVTDNSLNPQEFEVLTNMIHVLLEENRIQEPGSQ